MLVILMSYKHGDWLPFTRTVVLLYIVYIVVRRSMAIHATCSLHFLLQNLVTFPVIFPASFGIFRAPTSCVFLCWQGPCFKKCLIFKLNLNETQLVIKAMLKTANSTLIIELSIRKSSSRVHVQRIFGAHIASQKIYLQNSSISTIKSCTFNSHTYSEYIFIRSGCITWAPVKQGCLVYIKNSFK